MDEAREPLKKCPSCQHTVEAGLTRCTFCGLDLSKSQGGEGSVEGELPPKAFLTEMSERDKEKQANFWSFLKNLLMVVGVLIVLIGPFFLFGKVLLPLLVFDVMVLGSLLLLFLFLRQ